MAGSGDTEKDNDKGRGFHHYESPSIPTDKLGVGDLEKIRRDHSEVSVVPNADGHSAHLEIDTMDTGKK